MPKASTRTTRASRAAAPFAGGPHFRIEIADLHSHRFAVTLTIANPAAVQKVSLPVWIPGSYLVREFSKHLQNLHAKQSGKAVAVRQLDKHTWRIDCATDTDLVLHYEVYALDNSVRTAWLDAHRGFFNGTSLCLQVAGQDALPHTLELVASLSIAPWSVATGLTAVRINRQGFGTYSAANYDELADCPVEMGAFWSGSFTACGIAHRFIVAGALPTFDGARLLADTQKICEAEIRFWHGNKKPAFDTYLFMLNAVDAGYGGLEHRNSTALIAKRQDLPRLGKTKTEEGYTTLLGLISHEYFHTWNVKRLRPAELATVNYAQENYTELLWFFEGFTSYYDDLLLRRAQRIDNAGYLKLLEKTFNQVDQTPGRKIQSVAQASFDTWVKYYRQDENTPNATISYYTKGALVALCFDLTLRQEGKTTLDEVMRGLWTKCRGGPMTEADFAAVLQQLGGRSFAKEITNWIHSTRDLPVQKLLALHGVQLKEEPAQMAQRLGLRVTETPGKLSIQHVLRNGAAEKAGFCSADEWLGVEWETHTSTTRSKSSQPSHAWRIQKLADLPLLLGTQTKMMALVARGQRILRLPLTIPNTMTARLVIQDDKRLTAWLEGAA
jgi:predicted metalloprotease with PDZ domain